MKVTLNDYHFSELFIPDMKDLILSIEDNQFIFDCDKVMAVAGFNYQIDVDGK